MLTLEEIVCLNPAMQPDLHPLDRLYHLSHQIRTIDTMGLTEHYRTKVIPFTKQNLTNPCTEFALGPYPKPLTTTQEMLKLGQSNKNKQILPSVDYIGLDDWNPNEPSWSTVAAQTKFLAEYMGEFYLPESLLEPKADASQASMGFAEKYWNSSFYHTAPPNKFTIDDPETLQMLVHKYNMKALTVPPYIKIENV